MDVMVRQIKAKWSFFHVTAYGSYIGASPMVSTNMGAIMSGVMVIGKIGSGLSSDYLGRANVTALVILISGLLCLALWLNAYTEPAVWAFGILFGMYQQPFL